MLAFFVCQTYLLALPYGSGTYGTCQYSSCDISVNSNGTVSLSITPTASGVYSTASDLITVTTGDSNGYTLTLNDGDTDTNLVNGSSTIGASSGTQASPVTRSMNTWGYRIDGLGGFGAGPTSAESSVSSSTYTFAGVPASNATPDTLKVTSSAASSGDTTTIWFGAAVNSSKVSGAYTDSITYTATAN